MAATRSLSRWAARPLCSRPPRSSCGPRLGPPNDLGQLPRNAARSTCSRSSPRDRARDRYAEIRSALIPCASASRSLSASFSSSDQLGWTLAPSGRPRLRSANLSSASTARHSSTWAGVIVDGGHASPAAPGCSRGRRASSPPKHGAGRPSRIGLASRRSPGSTTPSPRSNGCRAPGPNPPGMACPRLAAGGSLEVSWHLLLLAG
jgi:hypothetical protein